jgi:hypothetical protein
MFSCLVRRPSIVDFALQLKVMEEDMNKLWNALSTSAAKAATSPDSLFGWVEAQPFQDRVARTFVSYPTSFSVRF